MRNYEIIRSYNDGKGNLYRFTEQNKNGETIEFSIERCGDWHNPKDKHALPYLWKKNGYINRVLPNYWHVSTYATDKNGNCYGVYNPQEKQIHRTYQEYTGKTYKTVEQTRNVIDFDFMFEATEENKQKIIAEIEKRAFQTFERVRKA